MARTAGALAGALAHINAVAADGDLDADPAGDLALDLDVGDALELPFLIAPDGTTRHKTIYPPRLHGTPVHEVAADLMDLERPENSRFLSLIGPPGTGKSIIARALAHHLWLRRGQPVAVRDGQPFYGFVELQPGPSADEYFFRYEFVPAQSGGDVRMIDSTFVEAMRNGWLVMLDEVNTARDVALLSINGTLDGRLTLHLPATGETVTAAPGFGVCLAFNPNLVGGGDIPDAWRSRFPAVIEVRSNWAAMVRMGCPRALVKAAATLDARRFAGDDGLVWTPQFRDVEGLVDMMARCGERVGLALFISNLCERVNAGVIQPAEAAATTRMLDEAGFAHLKVSPTGRVANLDGYPRATTS